MTSLIYEKQSKQDRKEKQEQRRLDKIANIPNNIHETDIVEVEYTAQSKKQVKTMRRAFTPARKEFIKKLARTQAQTLKDMGLSDKAIAEMAKGSAPNGYNVHHKMPLAGGGLNEESNFILIQNTPYHEDFHKIADPQISKMQDGEVKTVKMPIPTGSIFIPPDLRGHVKESVKQTISDSDKSNNSSLDSLLSKQKFQERG